MWQGRKSSFLSQRFSFGLECGGLGVTKRPEVLIEIFQYSKVLYLSGLFKNLTKRSVLSELSFGGCRCRNMTGWIFLYFPPENIDKIYRIYQCCNITGSHFFLLFSVFKSRPIYSMFSHIQADQREKLFSGDTTSWKGTARRGRRF